MAAAIDFAAQRGALKQHIFQAKTKAFLRHVLRQGQFKLGLFYAERPVQNRQRVRSVPACSWLHSFKEVQLRRAFLPIRRAPNPRARGHGQPRESATHVQLPAGSSG